MLERIIIILDIKNEKNLLKNVSLSCVFIVYRILNKVLRIFCY